jgi:hypothetical protein
VKDLTYDSLWDVCSLFEDDEGEVRMKRNPEDPEGQYERQSFCAEEGYLTYTDGYGVVISPKPAKKKSITDMVIEDLRGRERKGYETYGGPLLPHDGRDSMRDLYEELLDAAQYIRKVMEERE